MGHRKSSGRSSVYSSQGRRGTFIGVGAPSSSPPHRPLSHSSPVRQSSRPPRRGLWGNGGSRSNYNVSEDRQSPYGPNETYTWSENFGNISKSPNSLSFGSDGCKSISSDGGSSNSSTNSGSCKFSNNGSGKKALARPSNPLRYKTELCRSFEESGDCRFGSACTFAHGLRELRAVLRHPRYKTDLCRTYHGAGYCQYGARCHFVHDPEEAAGVAAMRGYKLRSQPPGVNTTLLTMSANCGVASRSDANGSILANLQRLHAYKAVEEKFGFLNSSGYGNDQHNSIGTLSPEPNYLSLNMLTIGQDNLSGLTSVSQPQGNFLGTSEYQPESISVNYMDMKAPDSGGSKLWRSSASLGGDWWDTDPEVTSQCSILNLDALHSSSRADTWRLGEVPTQTKEVIGNPMEVSRSLLIPSITELIHMP